MTNRELAILVHKMHAAMAYREYAENIPLYIERIGKAAATLDTPLGSACREWHATRAFALRFIMRHEAAKVLLDEEVQA